MIRKMQQLMEGLPNTTIRAKDLKTVRYVRLFLYTSDPRGPLYYYNFWACPKELWERCYAPRFYANVSITDVNLKPEQVLHIISTCRGTSFLAVRSTNPRPERLRWSLGVVTVNDNNYVNERDWLDINAQDRYVAVWMPGAVDE